MCNVVRRTADAFATLRLARSVAAAVRTAVTWVLILKDPEETSRP
jgi:hypothetical protein